MTKRFCDICGKPAIELRDVVGMREIGEARTEKKLDSQPER